MSSAEDDLDLLLEAKLGQELRQQLDGQLGRAAPYVRRRCDAQSDCRPVTRRRRGRWLTTLAAVAAACGAAFIAWKRHEPTVLPGGPVHKIVVAVEPPHVATKHVNDARPNGDGHKDHQEESSSAGQDSSSADGAPPSEAFLLGSALSTRTLDDGVLLVGRTPVRKLRRQWLERVEWFDPHNGARMQRIVPHEEVLFVPLPIN